MALYGLPAVARKKPPCVQWHAVATEHVTSCTWARGTTELHNSAVAQSQCYPIGLRKVGGVLWCKSNCNAGAAFPYRPLETHPTTERKGAKRIHLLAHRSRDTLVYYRGCQKSHTLSPFERVLKEVFGPVLPVRHPGAGIAFDVRMAQLTLEAPTRHSLSWWSSFFEKVSRCFKAFVKLVDSKRRCDTESLPLSSNDATGHGLAMSVARVCNMM